MIRRALDLFSGIGGWSLGLHRHGIETVAACENNQWKRGHYARHFPGVKIYDDVCALSAEVLARDGLLPIDIIVGSPPCTDISTANTSGLGVDGEHSRLYFEATRILGEVRPRWVVFENSANLRARGSDRVLHEMEAAGYTVWPLVVGAGHAGAPHRRLRSWLVGCRTDAITGADADGPGLRLQPRRSGRPDRQSAPQSAAVATHPNGEGEHGLAVDGQVGWRSGHAGHAVADRTGGGGNDADADGAGPPVGQMLGRYDGGQVAAIERCFGLDWADGPGALDRSLRALDGVSGRLAVATRRRDRIAITSQLSRARSAYGDAVALPVVEAVITAILATDRELTRR